MRRPEGERRAREGQEETPSSLHITIWLSFTTGCLISYRSTALRMASLSCHPPPPACAQISHRLVTVIYLPTVL